MGEEYSADDGALAAFAALSDRQVEALSETHSTLRSGRDLLVGSALPRIVESTALDRYHDLIETVGDNGHFTDLIATALADFAGGDVPVLATLRGDLGDEAMNALLDGHHRRLDLMLLDDETRAAVLVWEALVVVGDGDTLSFDELVARIEAGEADIMAANRSAGADEAEAEALYRDLLDSLAHLGDDDGALARFDGADDGDSRPGDPDTDGRFTVLDAETWALALARSSDVEAARRFRLDIHRHRLERGEVIDLAAVDEVDRISVADLVIDHNVQIASDPEAGWSDRTAALAALDQLNLDANASGGELRSHVGHRFVETGVGHQIRFEADGGSNPNAGLVATALVNQGVALLSPDGRAALVEDLSAGLVPRGGTFRSELGYLVDALDLDRSSEMVSTVTVGSTQTGYYWRVDAADQLLRATLRDDGTLRPGGTELFDLIVDGMMEAGGVDVDDSLNVTGPRYPGTGVRPFDLRSTLVAAAGAPNHGLADADHEVAVGLQELLDSELGSTADGQARIDELLAELALDPDTELFVIGAAAGGRPVPEALRTARFAADPGATNGRVDVLRFLLPMSGYGDPDLERMADLDLETAAGTSLAAETLALQAIQIERYNADSTRFTPPLSGEQFDLVDELEGNWDLLGIGASDLQAARNEEVASADQLHPPPNAYQTLQAIASGELARIDDRPVPSELRRLADRLLDPANEGVWAVLYAVEGDTWFGADGTYRTGGFDIEGIDGDVRWGNLAVNLQNPRYLDGDTFDRLRLQLTLLAQLGPRARRFADDGSVDGGADGRVTEDSIEDWLDHHAAELPPVLADRLAFGGRFGLGEDTFGWDEIAGLLGVAGLTAAAVVTFVPSAGTSPWVAAGLAGLGGLEAYAAYRAGDGWGAALATAGSVADGLSAARLLLRGGSAASSADEVLGVIRLADDPAAWDQLTAAERTRLFDEVAGIASRSGIGDLRRLARRADDLTPTELTEQFRAVVAADPERFIATLADAGHSPAEIARLRRDLGVPTTPTRFTTPGGTIIDPASIRSTVSAQRQGRHVVGDRLYNGGSYFESMEDAQRVLDDFHNGAAEVLGLKGNDIVIRTPNVTGFNHNPGAGFPNQPTNVFFIKGSSSPSVVPYNPTWSP